MVAMTQCPNENQIRSLIVGQVEQVESDLIFGHIEECDTCTSRLIDFDDHSDSLVEQVRFAGKQPHLEEPFCRVAVTKALGALATAAEIQSEPALLTESRFGDYEILRPLGQGGMGKVYLARHTKLGREVAIKFLADNRFADASTRERFEVEMRSIGKLTHPNVVTAYDARDIEGTAVLVTEFIDGMDLSQLARRTGRVPVAEACEIARQVAKALDYINEQGFVHRDVKPSNAMLSFEGDVKLLDLGLARAYLPTEAEQEITATGQTMGTADYLAPEQIADCRKVDARSDLYSLGCTLFKLLTGNAPFYGKEYQSSFAKMQAHVNETPPRLSGLCSDVPEELARLVDEMLAKDPANRPQSAKEVAQRLSGWSRDADLAAFIQRAPSLVPEPGTQTADVSKAVQGRWGKGRSIPIFVLTMIAVFALGAFFGGVLPRKFNWLQLGDNTLKQDERETGVAMSKESAAAGASSAAGGTDKSAFTRAQATDLESVLELVVKIANRKSVDLVVASDGLSRLMQPADGKSEKRAEETIRVATALSRLGRIEGLHRGVRSVPESLAWMTSEEQSVYALECDFQKLLFRDIKVFVDEYVGKKVFSEVIEGIEKDPNGPQVSLEREVLPALGSKVFVVVSKHDARVPSWILAIELKDATKIKSLLRHDPGFEKLFRIAGNHLIRGEGSAVDDLLLRYEEFVSNAE